MLDFTASSAPSGNKWNFSTIRKQENKYRMLMKNNNIQILRTSLLFQSKYISFLFPFGHYTEMFKTENFFLQVDMLFC